jgi:hypothetical protein
MSSDRYDALGVRNYVDKNGETRTAFTRLGTMFANSKGGFSLTLDALPTPSLSDKGAIETRILLVVPKPRDDDRGGGGSSDSVPF